MALPFEDRSERADLANDNADGSAPPQTDYLPSRGGQVCANCGAEIGAYRLKRMQMRGLILNCLSVVLLTALAFTVAYLLSLWAKHDFKFSPNHWVWHEPIEDWNL